MAQFNIYNNLTSKGRIEWLALPDAGESPEDVLSKVKQAAIDRFGGIVFFNRWERIVASNGYITVRMYA
ncbi:hypothetical protein N015_13150 [Pseudomonas asturiensis]|uniref:Uncharacterized protein n=1 Tax=Pseudomonas asturiensis TaxID=1190415 RepID=A0ABX6HCK7_9PSED|nr:hypothetical protein [Pseudomonas asturiensis]QHF03301.1 hypothetical protein N015_13150 [Pseudomonas asturiensis]